jgi:serine/threonine-protein kinase
MTRADVPPRCPSCGAALTPSGQFCSACGIRVGTVGDLPTQTGPLESSATYHPGRLLPPGSGGTGAFATGVVLGGRFRIVGLIGRGGMGEVYRADDLKLDQPVALKFLPDEVAARPGWRERFYAEVRFARQVSHPNVCRVYDVDEIDGRLFLSMEYIDGEHLASLLTRIGHLPASKVLEIAHQLCAGLAAAHRKGVLHRDLKPSNVMIDGRGVARITDFGLAVSSDRAIGSPVLLGTPVYMAPEQFAGHAASVQSDIYALGLVLYELVTGKTPFKARTLDDLRMEKEAIVPPSPSELGREIDPAIERVIVRCLERDPLARPSTVAEIAAALPGADPLAAALAAGETPSPAMVAASSRGEVMTPRVAFALTSGLAVATTLAVWLGGMAIMTRRVPLARPPDAFVERARALAERAGYTDAAVDSAYGLVYNQRYLTDLEARDRSPARWDALSPLAVTFWYRQSQHALRRLTFSIGVSPSVTPDDPPLSAPGELIVALTGGGRLVRFAAVPGPASETTDVRAETDWNDFFRDAGLDQREWTPVDPGVTPAFWADRQFAWRPAVTGGRDRPVRIEAASIRGRPTTFQVVYPWDATGTPSSAGWLFGPGAGAGPVTRSTRTATFVGIGLTGLALFGGLIVARRNLRLGRGDRRGASRLVIFVSVLLGVSWLLDEHHVADAHEWYLIVSFAGRALVLGGIFWWTYVAFEPYVRRHWPSTIVSWSRLLTGRIRDALVARDVLIGCAAGAVLTTLLMVSHLLPGWLGFTAERLATPTWHAWLGWGHAVSLVLQLVCNALLDAFTALFVLVLARLVWRREYVAAIAAAALLATPDVLLSDTPAIAGVFYFVVYFLGLLLLMRVGLLAVITLRFCVDLLQAYPIVPNLSAWYSSLGLAALALLAVLVAASLHTALAGPRQPLRH